MLQGGLDIRVFMPLRGDVSYAQGIAGGEIHNVKHKKEDSVSGKSTAITFPAGPTLRAASKASEPASQPKSRISAPDGISASMDTFETPAKCRTKGAMQHRAQR